MINRLNLQKYCTEDISLIENYEKADSDNTEMWSCHHRLETHFSDGTERPHNAFLSKAELIALGMYWDRPASELIFMTRSDHQALHNKKRKGQRASEETRRKLSEAHKGKGRGPKSEEHKRKLSESHKGLYKGKHWKLVDGRRVWYL